MAENKNMELNDKMMAKATGGAGQTGDVIVCDGTIMSDNVGKCKCNGVAYTDCDVQGDNGERYGCIWSDPNPPKTGTRVRIFHREPAGTEWYSGLYEAKRI